MNCAVCTLNSEKLWGHMEDSHSSWVQNVHYTLHEMHIKHYILHIADLMLQIYTTLVKLFSGTFAKIHFRFLRSLALIVAFPVGLNFNWLSVLESRTIKHLSVVRKVSIKYNQNCTIKKEHVAKSCNLKEIVFSSSSQMAEGLYLHIVVSLLKSSTINSRSNFKLQLKLFFQ